MLRASTYNIYITLPKDPQHVLLIHGYSGAYDIVSVEVANYLRNHHGSFMNLESSSSAPSDTTIDILKQRGYLTEMTVKEEETLFVRIVESLHARALRNIPTYVLMPTYDCNLRCVYCFQNYMREDDGNEYRPSLQLITNDMIELVFLGIRNLEQELDIIIDEDEIHRNIVFFGGEPLLSTQRDTIESYMLQIRALHGKSAISAVTNGTELEAYEDLLGPGQIETLQITLDGPEFSHDQRRVYPDNRGSYAQIVRNISMALAKNVEIRLRVNVDRDNVTFLPHLAKEIVERGWNKIQNFSAYVAPVTYDELEGSATRPISSWQLRQILAKMREEYPTMSVFESFDKQLENQILSVLNQDAYPQFRSSFCGAHSNMYVFDPVGDIYACWERTGDPKYRIGWVDSNGSIKFTPLHSIWRSRTVATNLKCRKCPYALYCGGGCAIEALRHSPDGNIFTNFCDNFQSRFRATVAEVYSSYIGHENRPLVTSSVCGK